MRKKIIVLEPALRTQSISRFQTDISIECIATLTANQYSHNSSLAMMKDWNNFVEFCGLKNVSPLPASSLATQLYLEQLSTTRKFSTIKRTAATIGVVHKFHSLNDPISTRKTRLLIKQLELSKHDDQQQAIEFGQIHLDKIYARWNNSDSLKLHRDLIIAALMFEIALKRSELRDLKIDNVSISQDICTIHLNSNNYGLSVQTNELLLRWIRISGINSGYLFTRIDRHENIGSSALDSSSIYRIFRNISDELGLKHNMSGQSPRVGAAKELANQGYKLKEITEFGRWFSPAMPAKYLKNQELANTEQLKFKSIKPWTE